MGNSPSPVKKMVLTERQRSALEGAVLEYLKENNYVNAYQAFASEAANPSTPNTSKSLEKKWTAVMRLEKKIQSYEKQIADLTNELKNTNPMSSVFQSKTRKRDLVPQTVKH